MRNDWSRRTDWTTVCKRAAGRNKVNALRQFHAALRRREVLTLLGELGWRRGTQQRIAERLGVSAATISRDLGRIMPLVEVCAACGHLAPREPW